MKKENPQLEPEIAKGDLQPFESVGLDMFSWKGNNYLLIVDRMSGYIFVENMKKNASCAKVTASFKLLCLTYGFPKSVRYDKGPTFSSEFERFLTDIKVELTPSSAGNPASNAPPCSSTLNFILGSSYLAHIVILWSRRGAT